MRPSVPRRCPPVLIFAFLFLFSFFFFFFINHSDDLSPLPSSPAPVRKIRIGGSRLLQIKGARSFRVKKGGSLSSIRRAGSLKSTKLSRQDSESENEEGQLSQTQSRDTVTDIGKTRARLSYSLLFTL